MKEEGRKRDKSINGEGKEEDTEEKKREMREEERGIRRKPRKERFGT